MCVLVCGLCSNSTEQVFSRARSPALQPQKTAARAEKNRIENDLSQSMQAESYYKAEFSESCLRGISVVVNENVAQDRQKEVL